MNSTKTWVVVAGDQAVQGLVDSARALSGEVVAVVAGARAVADATALVVDRVVWLGEPGPLPVEAFAPAVAELVADAAPLAVIGAGTPSARALLGAVAARLGSSVLTASAVELVDGQVQVTRAVLGGIVEHRTAVDGGTAVLVVDAGAVPAGGTAAPVEEVTVAPLTSARVVEMRAAASSGGDLHSAHAVVSVGRGLKAKADLALIQGLADALGAELACSRPLAEGVDWVAKDRYVGISGQHIAPSLYVAVGISGQLQHMVGVRGAGTVVAINADKAAPVFAQCDYGIVGDLYQVVPALTAALKGSA